MIPPFMVILVGRVLSIYTYALVPRFPRKEDRMVYFKNLLAGLCAIGFLAATLQAQIVPDSDSVKVSPLNPTLAPVSDSAKVSANNLERMPSIDSGLVTFKSGEGLLLRIPLDTASIFNGVFPIDNEGYVNLPVLGKLHVHGKSSRFIEGYLSVNGAQYMRDIHVLASPVIRITLLGHWQRPGMYYVNALASVWEACRIAGGPAGEVNLNKWKVHRGDESLGIPLLNNFSQGTTLRGAGIQSGDIFVIPVPNMQTGPWYVFRESLTMLGQLATITASVLVSYVIVHNIWYPPAGHTF